MMVDKVFCKLTDGALVQAFHARKENLKQNAYTLL